MDGTAVRVVQAGYDSLRASVVSDPCEVRRAVAAFMDQPNSTCNICRLKNVGLEINKTYRDDESGRVADQVALLTLCNSANCVMFQLSQFGWIPSSLAVLLGHPQILFYSMGMKDCSESLRRDYGLAVRNAMEVELSAYSARACCQPPTTIEFGCWDAKDLTDSQVEYAAANAYEYWKVANRSHPYCRCK